MERIALEAFQKWMVSPHRKPLVVRGARQVGKTWLIRHFAEICQKKLVELNFEKNPEYASLFIPNDPKAILLNLEAMIQRPIDPENSILFLDEIQSAPELLAKLRWFAEDLPEWPVIAAGSLLEFMLADHTFSMPVGRISYLHLEPLSFLEFLKAQQGDKWCKYLARWERQQEIPVAIHHALMNAFREYALIGGLPAVVSSWIQYRSLGSVSEIQQDLISTYRHDFNKYKGRFSPEMGDEIIRAIPQMLGQKFVFSRVNPARQSSAIKNVFNSLTQSRICHRVKHAASNGIPLSAAVNDKYFKAIFLDVGLVSAILKLNLNDFQNPKNIMLINHGGLAEQVVGQMLRTLFPYYMEPELYCWHREEKSANAEIDYVIQHKGHIIPIEIKAGSTGSLKSLHVFMALKKSPLAVRINADVPSWTEVNVKDHEGKPIRYSLLSIPFYAVHELNRLLDEILVGLF